MCGLERATLFWFLLGTFSLISEATFSGDIGGTRQNGQEAMVTLKCREKGEGT